MYQTDRFGAVVAREHVPLDEAAALIAVHAYPGLEVGAQLEALDRLADGCPEPTLHGVVRELFGRQRFQGNVSHYYDPRNSLLNDVLARRVGIPITLSVLTIEVGRRLGVPLHGVGMPGHFLVGDRVQSGLFVDPFAGGTLLDRRACRRLFHAVNGDQPFEAHYLRPTSPRDIVRRMLANLAAIYSGQGDQRSLRWVLELRCRLPGAGAADLAELARVLAWCGRYDEAAARYEEAAARSGGSAATACLRQAARLRAVAN